LLDIPNNHSISTVSLYCITCYWNFPENKVFYIFNISHDAHTASHWFPIFRVIN
jgi:hypothetical protein